jgi:hypothetical protein
MAKYAQITYGPYRTKGSSTGNPSPVDLTNDGLSREISLSRTRSSYQQYTDIYIELRDELGNKILGNYDTVNYQEFTNGIPGSVFTATLIGLRTPIYKNVLVYEDAEDYVYTFDAIIISTVIENNGSYIPPAHVMFLLLILPLTKRKVTLAAKMGRLLFMHRRA